MFLFCLWRRCQPTPLTTVFNNNNNANIPLFSLFLSHVKSDYSLTIIKLHSLACIPGTSELIFEVVPFFSVYTISPLSRCQATWALDLGTAVLKCRNQAKMAAPYSIIYCTYAPGLSTRSCHSSIVAQPPQSSICYHRATFTPSNITSVYPVPSLHLLPPSTSF